MSGAHGGRGRGGGRGPLALAGLGCHATPEAERATPDAGCLAPVDAPLALAQGERLLVFAPHPDDESLGAGGLVQAVLANGGSVRIVTFTAGDGYPEALAMERGDAVAMPADYLGFGERRLAELRSAALELGGPAVRVDALGFPDGALARVIEAADDAPVRSATTDVDRVPYAEALAPGTPYSAHALARLLARVLDETRPTLVALPDPHEQHPDHATTALASLRALAEWRQTQQATARTHSARTHSGRTHSARTKWDGDLDGDPSAPRDADDMQPRVVAYLVHWGPHPAGWQRARTDTETAALPLCLPASLPRDGRREVTLALRSEWIAGKRRAIAAHATQQGVMGRYLASFARANEAFLLFPPD